MKMEYALYLGCTIPLKMPHFESAFRQIAEFLEFKFKEMEGASCCPDPVATQSTNIHTWLTLAARNLCLAEKMGLDVMTICSGCFETLKTTKVLLEEHKEDFDQVNTVLKKIGYKYKGTSEVYHFIEIFSRPEILGKIKNILVKPLDNLNVAVHYGCHLVRPSKILQFDHPERPKTMDKIIEALGAKTVDFAAKLECCGFCARLNEDIGFQLVQNKMTELVELETEVDVMVGVCPACVGQYDRKQRLLSRKIDKVLDIPVLYMPELMAIAFGIEPDKLGLTNRSVRPTKLLEKLNV